MAPSRHRIGRPTLARLRVRHHEGKEVITTMTALIRLLSSADRSDERGQGLAEYALILTFIAVVLVVALAFFGGQINTMLSNVGTSI